MADVTYSHAEKTDFFAKVGSFFSKMVKRFQFERATHELSLLNTHTLEDIGLTRADLASAKSIDDLRVRAGGYY